MTEFIYRLEVRVPATMWSTCSPLSLSQHHAIPDTKQWNSACSNNRWFPFDAVLSSAAEQQSVAGVFSALLLCTFSMFAFMTFIAQTIAKRQRRHSMTVERRPEVSHVVLCL